MAKKKPESPEPLAEENISPEEDLVKVGKKSSDKQKIIRMLSLLAGVIVLVVGGALLFGSSEEPVDDQSNEQSTPVITSYQECVDAGYPIMESFPEQCSVPDGETFTRELTALELRNIIRDLPNPKPTVETPEFAGETGDEADDMAIWIHPDDPAKSVIIADNKSSDGGLFVYDLKGKLVHSLDIGAIGNVDLRQNVELNGESTTLISATDRANNSLRFFTINPDTRKLSELETSNASLAYEPYGLCMYQSAVDSAVYTFVTSRAGDQVLQYKLDTSGAKISFTDTKRDLKVTTLAEGCAADDAQGTVYIAEEEAALWRYGAEPGDKAERTRLDTEENGGSIGYDLEGVAVIAGEGDEGFVVVSRQGTDTFALYERSEGNKFIKEFRVLANGDIDASTITDGLDAAAVNLGPDFPNGILVVHDSENTGGSTSNLKYVPLESVIGTNSL